MENQKKYGLHKCNLDDYNVNLNDEYVVYLYISRYEEHIDFIKSTKDENIFYSEKYVEEMQYDLEYLIYYTKNFGVKIFHDPQKDEHVSKSVDFLRWYKYWDEFDKELDCDEADILLGMIKNKEDLSKFLPDSPWKENLKKNNILAKEKE